MMKNRIVSALLIVLSLAMLVGCGRRAQDNNGANAPDRTQQQNSQNDTVNDLPPAPDNGSHVQGDRNTPVNDGKTEHNSVTQDAKNVLDDAGDMVGDAAKGVGDAVQDVGDAAKNATDGNKNTTQNDKSTAQQKK